MPLRDSGSKGHSRYFVDGAVLAQLMRAKRPGHAVLERVSSRPGQGVAGIFTFGRGIGVIEGVLQTLDIPISYVAPQVWKKYFGLIKQGKDKSLALAREFYPDAELPLKKHEGRAEAILIGLWKIEQWRTAND
ncbi:MAG: hypothetical protein V3T23_02170 [Nitrososphaerales archaeon]